MRANIARTKAALPEAPSAPPGNFPGAAERSLGLCGGELVTRGAARRRGRAPIYGALPPARSSSRESKELAPRTQPGHAARVEWSVRAARRPPPLAAAHRLTRVSRAKARKASPRQ